MKFLLCIFSILLLSHVARAQQSNQQDTTRPIQLGQQGWVRIPIDTNSFVAVGFISADTCYAVNAASYYRSVDGGSSWHRISWAIPLSSGMAFTDPQRGYVSDGGHTCFRTSNGGVTWDSTNDQLQIASYVTAVSRDTVYIAGSNDVSHTYDGGKTWSRSTIAGPGINGIAFRDGLHGVVVGSVQPGPQPHHELTAACFTTDDGGKTWVQHYTGATQELVSCTYLDTKSLLAIGALGIAFRSTDQGLSWSRVDSGATHEYYEIALRNQTAIAVGVNGLIRATLDGGTTWYNQASGVSVTLTSVQMFNDKIALASGDSGIILKTTNGGVDWVQISPPNSQAIISQSYPEPSHGALTLSYSMPQLQHVTLSIVDVTGRLIATVVNNELTTAGDHQLSIDANQYPPGIYYYMLRTERFQGSGKFTIVK